MTANNCYSDRDTMVQHAYGTVVNAVKVVEVERRMAGVVKDDDYWKIGDIRDITLLKMAMVRPSPFVYFV